ISSMVMSEVPSVAAVACIFLTALIARARRTDARVSSRSVSVSGVSRAMGFPLFVITISCSSGSAFHTWAGVVRRSRTVMNFICHLSDGMYTFVTRLSTGLKQPNIELSCAAESPARSEPQRRHLDESKGHLRRQLQRLVMHSFCTIQGHG